MTVYRKDRLYRILLASSCVVLLLVSLHYVTAYYQCLADRRRLQEVLRGLKPMEVRDAATTQPLTGFSVGPAGQPDHIAGVTLPLWAVMAGDTANAMRFLLVGVEPTLLRVRAKGYRPQTVRVGPDSFAEVVVALERE